MNPPCLEQLLSLKAEETPPPEFWDDFDRQLREKSWRSLKLEGSLKRRLGRLALKVSTATLAVAASLTLLWATWQAQVGTGGNKITQEPFNTFAHLPTPDTYHFAISSLTWRDAPSSSYLKTASKKDLALVTEKQAHFVEKIIGSPQSDKNPTTASY